MAGKDDRFSRINSLEQLASGMFMVEEGQIF